MELLKSPEFKNLIIRKNRESIQVRFRKKYDLAMFLFFIFVFGFIAAMLLWALPLSIENNPDSEKNPFYFYFQLIMYVVGIPLFIAFWYEILKREWIKIDIRYLTIGFYVLGFGVFVKKYELDMIEDVKPANLPSKKWEKVEGYEVPGHKRFTSYTKDTRNIYPTLVFKYQEREIYFGNGLNSDEVQYIIDLIRTKYSFTK
jgi:hypothetical protein